MSQCPRMQGTPRRGIPEPKSLLLPRGWTTAPEEILAGEGIPEQALECQPRDGDSSATGSLERWSLLSMAGRRTQQQVACDPACTCDILDLSASVSALFIPHQHEHLSFGCSTATEDAGNVSLYLLNSFPGAPHPEDAHRLETWETDRSVLCTYSPPPPQTVLGAPQHHVSGSLALHAFPTPGRGGKKKGFGDTTFLGSIACRSGRRTKLYSHSETDAGCAPGDGSLTRTVTILSPEDSPHVVFGSTPCLRNQLPPPILGNGQARRP